MTMILGLERLCLLVAKIVGVSPDGRCAFAEMPPAEGEEAPLEILVSPRMNGEIVFDGRTPRLVPLGHGKRPIPEVGAEIGFLRLAVEEPGKRPLAHLWVDLAGEDCQRVEAAVKKAAETQARIRRENEAAEERRRATIAGCCSKLSRGYKKKGA